MHGGRWPREGRGRRGVPEQILPSLVPLIATDGDADTGQEGGTASGSIQPGGRVVGEGGLAGRAGPLEAVPSAFCALGTAQSGHTSRTRAFGPHPASPAGRGSFPRVHFADVAETAWQAIAAANTATRQGGGGSGGSSTKRKTGGDASYGSAPKRQQSSRPAGGGGQKHPLVRVTWTIRCKAMFVYGQKSRLY